MKKPFILLCLLSIPLLFATCKQEVLTPGILVSPGTINIYANAGELIEFTIEALAGDKDLQNIKIEQKPIGSVTSTVLDTIITGRRASFFFVYNIPEGHEELILSFTAIDTDGNQGQTARRLTITGNEFLQESPGNEIYSVYSNGNPNVFDIDELSPLFLSNQPDTASIDIIELDPDDDDLLSNTWSSWSGIKFVRNNSFNYPEATQSSAAGSYESSTALQVINNLQVDDILITKYDTINQLYAVIKITEITDNAGTEDDHYEFNVMK